jgi:hypothetical protein
MRKKIEKRGEGGEGVVGTALVVEKEMRRDHLGVCVSRTYSDIILPIGVFFIAVFFFLSAGYQVKTDEVRGALMFRNFEWDAKKAQILEKYTVKDQIQVSFMQETQPKVISKVFLSFCGFSLHFSFLLDVGLWEFSFF